MLMMWVGCGRTALVSGLDRASVVDGGSCGALGTGEADAELMRRWNLAVDGLPALTRDFHWRDVSDFPHPTYRRGDAVAYAEFVDVLARFWGDASTVDFVTCNALFDRGYKSGPAVATQKTVQLRPLTLELSTYSLVDVTRQAALVQACLVIDC